MKGDKFLKVCLKSCTCYYFDDIIKFEDFDFGNILLDEKLYKKYFMFHTEF